MKRTMKKLLAVLLVLIMLGTTVTAVFAEELPQFRDIDVVVRKVTDGSANIYSATISAWSSEKIQAGRFRFEFSSSQLLSTTKLKLHQITEDTEGYDWFLSKMGKLGSKVAPFDIYCVDDNGVRSEFSGSISVTLKLPNDYKEPVLYFLDTDGGVEEVSASFKGNSRKCSFTVSQSGYYVFVDRAGAAEGTTYYTITSSTKKGGSITPDGAQIVEAGAEMTFLISADDGYRISDVTVDGTSVGAVDSYTFSEIQADHTIQVKFKRTKVTVKTVVEDIIDWLIGDWINP